MTPDEILAALPSQDRLPREAMIAARERRNEMTPLFLDHLERMATATAETLSDEDRDAGLFICYLLAEWREPKAYRPLTRLLRQEIELLDLLLGDALTEAGTRLVASVFDGDLQPIFDAIEDAEADEFARAQMVDALVAIAHLHPLSRPAVVSYLEGFFSSDMSRTELLWGAWAFAVADLGLAHLEPQVQQAFEREWVSPAEASFEFFQEQLQEAVRTGASGWFERSRNARLIEDAVEELSGWHCFSEEYRKSREGGRSTTDWVSALSGTFQHETPKVGRNDPCPCGSGKKHKKCCMA